MPVYNPEHTLEATVPGLPGIVDRVIPVDGRSSHATPAVARRLEPGVRRK